VQPSTPGPFGQTVVEALPGRKHAVGYVYQILKPVSEERPAAAIPAEEPTGPSKNAGGFWDIATPRVASDVPSATLAGRKRSATSNAPGYMCRGPGPAQPNWLQRQTSR
jgi:hypothetical protein